MNRLLALLLIPLFGSCAGYHMGGIKPKSLEGVKTISVSMFDNSTLHPRAEAIATSAVADAISKDGTYRIARSGDADAILEGRVVTVDYGALRGTRYDTLRPEELSNTVILSWVLKDAKDPTRVLASGYSEGNSQLFVAANLQTARNNALPEAFERAGEDLAAKLSDGY